MPKKNLKSAISALFGALLVLSLTGCSAAGPDAMTRLTRQVTDGVEGKSGDIRVVNVLLVEQEDGSAVLVGTVANSGEASDSITQITADGIPGVFSAPELFTNEPAIFEGDSSNSSARFEGLNAKASGHVTIQFYFAGGAPVILEAIVREKNDIYENVGN